uniref:Uncharacterized protein n=1 Tax=Arundo donax TaxID=35708 RepID=A0A0A8YJB2_ARUDO
MFCLVVRCFRLYGPFILQHMMCLLNNHLL